MKPTNPHDTIAAIATPVGVGAIGIVRLSGPDSKKIMARIFRSYSGISPERMESHKLYYGCIKDRKEKTIDEVLSVLMKGPSTYTREDILEIHSHGNRKVLENILVEVISCGARLAEPGEFTKRAFLAGRIDLTEAEAVTDLIHARTSGGIELATSQLQGRLSAKLSLLKNKLVQMLAHVEVAIDFPDEENEIIRPDNIRQELQQEVIKPARELVKLADKGKIIREGALVVIAGRPNVGKSSLLNLLLQEERALVADIPGTTRDTVEETVSINGIPVHLIDTAGIRQHDDSVEELGIKRAKEKIEQADLILFLIDSKAGINKEDMAIYQTIAHKPHVLVFSKKDLVTKEEEKRLKQLFPEQPGVAISSKNREGINRLEQAIYHEISGEDTEFGEQVPYAPNTRHKTALLKLIQAGKRLDKALKEKAPADILAIELQSAIACLDEIVGLTTTDDILDQIFSEFCLGK